MPPAADAPAPAAPLDPRPARRRLAACLAGLLLLAAGAFLNGLHGEFVFDDAALVEGFRCAREPSAPLRGLLLLSHDECAYRPVRYLSYSVDYALWGLRPFGYHLTNLLLHLAAVALVFLLIRRLLRAGPEPPPPDRAGLLDLGAFAGAALFALHPVQVEAVTYISGRRDLLTALLALGCVLAFLRYRETGRRRWALPILPLFYLALQSKEMAITTPALLLLADASRTLAALPAASRPAGLRARVLHHLAAIFGPVRRHPWLFGSLLLLAIWFFGFRGVAQPATHHPGFWGGTRWTNTATAAGLVPKYVQLVLWPATLLADYSADAQPIHPAFLSPLPLLGLGLYLALAAAVLLAFGRFPRAVLAAAWFGIALLPVLHFIPHHELMAEHHLYLPLMGAAVAAGAGFVLLLPRRRTIALVLLGGLLVALGLRTLVRNGDWRDEATLLEAELAVTDDCARVHWNYAVQLWRHPERDLPDRRFTDHHLRRALQIQSRTNAGVSRIPPAEVSAMLGTIRLARGDLEPGVVLLERGLRLARRDGLSFRSLEVLEAYVVGFLNLGGLGEDDARRGFLRRAAGALEDWLPLAPDRPRVLLLRGKVHHRLCELDAARADYRELLETAPAIRVEAAELTAETFLEAGDVPGLTNALAAAAARGLASPLLDGMRERLERGVPLPPPRCPPGNALASAGHS